MTVGESGKLSRCGGHGQFRGGAQVPDQAPGENQADGDQLRAGKNAAEDGATAGIVADEFDTEAGDTVEEQICAENLAIKFLSAEHPAQKKEDAELGGGFEELSGFARNQSIHEWRREEILERDSPPMGCRLAVAAAGGKTAEATDAMPDCQAWCECIAGSKRGHVMLSQKPPGNDERGDEASGEDAT